MTEEERDAADPWLTLAEIADELRVNPATVRQWVTKGQLKASRAGVRKWIVRRSELDRMLAETSPPVDDDAPVDTNLGEPRSAFDAPEDSNSAIALYQVAGRSFEAAFAASAYPPPSPGYLDRTRRLADGCEHMAATMLNASKVAGVQWVGRSNFRVDSFPYELRPGGNRPGAEELWQDFDAVLERFVIATSGTDLVAVANAFRELADALLDVADELERDDSWHAGSEAG